MCMWECVCMWCHQCYYNVVDAAAVPLECHEIRSFKLGERPKYVGTSSPAIPDHFYIKMQCTLSFVKKWMQSLDNFCAFSVCCAGRLKKAEDGLKHPSVSLLWIHLPLPDYILLPVCFSLKSLSFPTLMSLFEILFWSSTVQAKGSAHTTWLAIGILSQVY